MTIATTTVAPPLDERHGSGRLVALVHDVVVLTRRNLVHVAREPAQLSDVTIQPVLFTILFIWILGSGIQIRGGIQGIRHGRPALVEPHHLGRWARQSDSHRHDHRSHRPLPRPAHVARRRPGRTHDRRPDDGCDADLVVSRALPWAGGRCVAGSVLAGFGVALLFTSRSRGAAPAWASSPKAQKSAQCGLIVLFPLAIVSNAMVPTTHAGVAAPGGRLESGERGHRRSPAPIGQPEPICFDTCLADATSRGRRPDLVGGDHCVLCSARGLSVPPTDHGLIGTIVPIGYHGYLTTR